MLNRLLDMARPLLFAMEPECAHELTLRALETGFTARGTPADDPCLQVNVMGLHFPNPVGVAAGFDKDARVYKALRAAGFGFSEVGTVTPRPQRGNPKPRVIRLIHDRAIINRLGFNNGGHDAVHTRLSHRTTGDIIGVNIGANKDTVDKAADYVSGIERFYDLADYFMINVSSPNTPGLRDLQAPEQLDALLVQINDARKRHADSQGRRVPIAVKLAPDVAIDDVPAIAERLIANHVDAIAVSNTTIARPQGLDPRLAKENGGLSGRPLFHRSTVMLARVYRAVDGALPLIGIGGIESGAAAQEKIEAGASLIQIYTGLVYGGLPLLDAMKSRLSAATKNAGAAQISALVGIKAEEWAAKSIET